MKGLKRNHAQRGACGILIWQLRFVSLFGVASIKTEACPFCYTAAAAAKAGAIHALQSGILVLILPPILIFAVIAVTAVRRRHRYHEVRHPAPTAAARD